MRKLHAFNRRMVLAGIVGACGLSVFRWPGAETEIATHRDLAIRVTKLLGLDSGPVRPSAQASGLLKELFAADAAQLIAIARQSDLALRRLLEERIKADYTAGALVSVGGLWLTAAEASAMQLAAHLYENRPAPACYAVSAWLRPKVQSHG